MPLFDFQCQTASCGRVFEQYLPLARYQERPACPDCQGATTRAYLPSGTVSAAQSIVVFRAPDGSYRFPGSADGLSVAGYEKQGYTRVEVRGWAEVRKFEKQVNTQQYSDICRRMEKLSELRELGEARRSAAFRDVMAQMSRAGRDVARAAVQLGQQRPSLRAYDPGFHVEAYSHDRSNRDVARGSDGRRLRD